MGYGFLLQANELPGKPDMLLPDYDTVIFVRGCFGMVVPKISPKENAEYWNNKLDWLKEKVCYCLIKKSRRAAVMCQRSAEMLSLPFFSSIPSIVFFSTFLLLFHNFRAFYVL
jgi:hypothetical protein